LDDVQTGQPALALAQKVIQRVRQAGLPAEFIPAELTTITLSADVDAENTLRAAVLDFVESVRTVEKAIAAARRGDSIAEELDMTPLGFVTEEEWRAHWPSESDVKEPEPELEQEAELASDPAEAPKESRPKKRKGRR
jgi:XTP/dITP diphosphohydrolase